MEADDTECEVCGRRLDGVERRAAREPVDWRLARRAAGIALLYAMAGCLVWRFWLGRIYVEWIVERSEATDGGMLDAALINLVFMLGTWVAIGLGAGVAAKRRGGRPNTAKAAGMVAAGLFWFAVFALAFSNSAWREYLDTGLGVTWLSMTLFAAFVGRYSARLGGSLVRPA